MALSHNAGRRVLTVALAAALVATPPASAGILDSIKGLFGMGSSTSTAAAAGTTDLAALMDKVEASQKDLAAKQSDLSGTYNGSLSNIKSSDTALQGKLDAMQQSSNGNSQLYLSLLQAKSDAVKADPKALATVNDRITKITSTQEALESNYQKIQDTNRQAGFFTPTGASPAASQIAANDTGHQGDVWNDPTAQKAIDEWLSKCNLNQWGQWTGANGRTTVRSAGAPDSAVGKSRYETVYKMLANDSAHSNITLADYVEQRMNGQSPNVAYTAPAGGGIETASSDTAPIAVESVPAAPPPAPTVPAAAVQTAAASSIAQPSNGGASDADVSVVDAQIKGNYDKLMDMQKSGQGTSDAAKAVLKDIEGLQTKRTTLVKQLGR